jgi:hypothetical protein
MAHMHGEVPLVLTGQPEPDSLDQGEALATLGPLFPLWPKYNLGCQRDRFWFVQKGKDLPRFWKSPFHLWNVPRPLMSKCDVSYCADHQQPKGRNHSQSDFLFAANFEPGMGWTRSLLAKRVHWSD